MVNTDTTLAPAPTPETLPLAPLPRSSIMDKQALRFRVDPDKIQIATSDLPDRDREALRWFAQHCRNRNFAPEDINGKLLRRPDGDGFYSWTSIYHTLVGNRNRDGASIENIVASILSYKQLVEDRDGLVSSGFIETRLARVIFRVCRRARARQKFTMIFGDSQIGKTTALEEYARQNNHGSTVFTDMPEAPTLATFLVEFGMALGFLNAELMSVRTLKRRIFDSVDGGMLLIFDNVHRALKGREDVRAAIFEFLQRLYDKKRCGIVLSMTNEGRDLLKKGNASKRLEQIWRRRITPLQLPAVPPLDDLALFAQAYALEAADSSRVTVKMTVLDEHGNEQEKRFTESPLDLQTRVIKDDGLGVWKTLLEEAHDMAAEAGRKITWGAVLKAYCRDQADTQELL